MKILLLLSLLFTCNVLAAQKKKPVLEQVVPAITQLSQKVFEYGHENNFTDSCTFYFECDCCFAQLLFADDSTFYYANACAQDFSISSGHYSLGSNELSLHFSGDRANKIFEGENELNEASYSYSASSSAPHTSTLHAHFCKERLLFSSAGKTEIAAELKTSFEEIMQNPENKYLISILDQYKAVKQNSLAGLDVFTPHNDSVIIEKYLAWLDKEFHYQALFDESYPLYGGSCDEGKVLYAPDSLFRIFNFTGSAYRNSYATSLLQLRSGHFINCGEMFGDIESLFKASDSVYAVIQSSSGGGTGGGTYTSLWPFKMGQDTIICSPFEVTGNDEPAKTLLYDSCSFSIFAPWHENNYYIKYDPEKQKILYRYSVEKSTISSDSDLLKKVPGHLHPKNTYDALIVSGEFDLVGRTISNIKESYIIEEYQTEDD